LRRSLVTERAVASPSLWSDRISKSLHIKELYDSSYALQPDRDFTAAADNPYKACDALRSLEREYETKHDGAGKQQESFETEKKAGVNTDPEAQWKSMLSYLPHTKDLLDNEDRSQLFKPLRAAEAALTGR
jgi:hypothetical protein